MRIFGLEITRATTKKMLQSVNSSGGWFKILESYAGAWQQNIEIDHKTVTTHPVLFRCMTLVAGDIAKLRVKLVEMIDEVWTETTSPAFSPVLKKPNGFQTRIQFFESWVLSKLGYGNAYALKQRDGRGNVTALHILDPKRVKPLVSETGEVYYELQPDFLGRVGGEVIVVPAREIIHDRIHCLFHPLVGLSPIHAAGLSATQGVNMQAFSTNFFANGARPSGLLIAPGDINEADAKELKDYWNTNFTGDNSGKVALLSNNMKFETVTASAENTQLVEQYKMNSEAICTAFGVPAYKVGVGQAPANDNIEALQKQYYTDCLQIHVEQIEVLLDEGLALPDKYGTEFDTANLMRMDMATQAKVAKDLQGVAKPNELRSWFGWGKVEGGDTVYMQQQNYSLEALSKRDAKDDPFAKGKANAPAPPPANDDEEVEQEAAKALAEIRKGLA